MSDMEDEIPDDDHTPGKRRTPYNKGACKQCGVAKTKCIPLPNSSRCERWRSSQHKDKPSNDRLTCPRCEKLNRECTARAPQPRKRRSVPATQARVANLEHKLDSIVSLLSTTSKEPSSEHRSPQSQPSGSLERDISTSSGPSPHSAQQQPNGYREAQGAPTYERGCPPTAAEATPFRDSLRTSTEQSKAANQSFRMPRELEVHPNEAEALLQTYQTVSTPYFPFAIAQSSVSSQRAEENRPFFIDVIHFVTSPSNYHRQVALGEKVLNDVATRLLLCPEKTSELLQGLLLYAAWNYIMFPINGQMTTLLHMAKSLIVNLQLDRPPGAINRRLLFMKGYVAAQVSQAAKDASPRTLDEQRGLLGCYYLTSVKCMISGSVVMDQFDYNQYIEECCNALEAAKQVSTDVQAAYMVRLQRIVDSISKAFPRGENPAVETRIRAPMYMAIKTLQNELYEFKKTWPDELQQNTILLLHYYSAEVFLYETIFLERIDGKSAPMERLHTLEILNNCLVAIKNYEEIYRTIPQSHYAYFPFTTWIQSGLVTQTACELCFYDHPGWELPYIRAQLDIPRFIQYEMNSIQSIINVRRTPEMGVANKDIFHRFLRRHINMKSAYESRLSSETEAQSSHAQGQENVTMSSTTPAAALLPSMEDIYMGGLYYDFDNAFWQDFGLGAGNWASLGTGTGTSMGTGAGLGQYAGA